MEKMKKITLTLKNPRNPGEWFTGQWKQYLESVKQTKDIPFLVLFGEVLKILDHTENIFFESSVYEESSAYGPWYDWTLKTVNLLISRDHKETLSDSWQRIDVVSNSFITEGFSGDFYIDWNGRFYPPVEITFGGITADEAEAIRQAAGGIFFKPVCHVDDYRSEDKIQSDIRRNELFNIEP